MKLKHFLFVLGILFVGAGCAPLDTTDSPKEISVKTDFTAEDRLKWKRIAQWPDLCDEDFKIGSDAGLGGLAFYPISETRLILRVTCGVYAYQNSMLFYLVNTAEAVPTTQLLSAPIYDIENKQIINRTYEYTDDIQEAVLGSDSFDSTNKTITIFTKERGVGDCGGKNIYRIENKKLILVKFQSLSCEQVEQFRFENPEATELPEWPVIYEKK